MLHSGAKLLTRLTGFSYSFGFNCSFVLETLGLLRLKAWFKNWKLDALLLDLLLSPLWMGSSCVRCLILVLKSIFLFLALGRSSTVSILLSSRSRLLIMMSSISARCSFLKIFSRMPLLMASTIDVLFFCWARNSVLFFLAMDRDEFFLYVSFPFSISLLSITRIFWLALKFLFLRFLSNCLTTEGLADWEESCRELTCYSECLLLTYDSNSQLLSSRSTAFSICSCTSQLSRFAYSAPTTESYSPYASLSLIVSFTSLYQAISPQKIDFVGFWFMKFLEEQPNLDLDRFE